MPAYPPPDPEPLPKRMRNLRVDPERGYVVPWFVQWIDGKPEFRSSDPSKWLRAVQEKRCWVCGEPLGVWLTFVLGPMSALSRATVEPPNHLECAQWSARHCPFLNQTENKYREDQFTKGLEENVAGVGIARQPGVTLLWTTKSYSVVGDPKGKPLIRVGDPSSTEWYCKARAATRVEVEIAVDAARPFLEKAAQRPGALKDLQESFKRVAALYPPA